jgi:hypothetical protein
MDDDIKKVGRNHNIFKGVVYTGIAGMIGAGIYLLSKYKHLGGRASYTIAGIALLVSAPSIIDVVKTAVVQHNELEKVKIYTSVKKDSIDAILNLKKPKDTSTLYIKEFFDKASETTKAIEATYKEAISDNSRKYKTLLEKSDKQYDSMYIVLVEQNKNLNRTIDGLKRAAESSYSVINPNSVATKNTGQQDKTSLERIASQYGTTKDKHDSEDLAPSYYFIDADKSDGEIQVYGIFNDGTKKHLSIASKASFAMDGGPVDGSYVLRNKGARYGELYPGFLEMDDPVGISGAGQDNQYLEEIQDGALANKTGIRVPNEIYDRIARLVDERKTIINVHE